MGLIKALRRSWLNLSLRRKGLLVTTLPVAALTTFSVAFLVVQHQYRTAGQWIRHALEVSSASQRVHTLLLDSDDAIKGYALTGEPRDLARYRASGARAQQSVDQLQPMLNGRADQIAHLNNLRSLFREKRRASDDYLAAMHDSARDRSDARSQAWLAKNRIALAMIDAELAAMQKLDRELLVPRTVQLTRALKAADLTGAASILIGLAGGISAMLLFATGIVRRVQRLQVDASRLAEGHLPASPDSAKDEIGKAAQALRATADLLGRRNQDLERRACELAESHAANEHQSRLLQCILDSMGDGVIAADQTGEMILVNPAIDKLFGSDSIRVGQNGWLDLKRIFQADGVTPCAAEELPLRRAIGGETPGAVELFIRDIDGDGGRWVNVVSRPFREEGAVAGGVSVIRDVSLEKRAEESLRQAREEAERANQAKSEFLSRMSHELRTPLNSVLGFAQLLEIDPLTAPQRQSVEQILKGGRHLLGLINEVLDLARIEAGRLALSTEPIAVHEAVQSAIDLVMSLSVQSGIALKMDDSAAWNRYILADRQRFQQVVLNLLSNAVKYNRPGGAVTVACHTEEESRFHLSVHDTGYGIPSDKVSLLFQPFERLGADQSGIEGTGIGLALSRRLVEAMGGHIGGETVEGAGSTFWVELPLCACPLETYDQSLGAEAQDLRRDLGGKTASILYVEDNLSNNLLMERILESRPEVKLISAMQGRLGLELARQHSPDLIFLDLHLPDINGKEVLHGLRSDPKTRSIPVAMISADATPGQVERLLAAGAQEYFTKPLDVKRLLQFVDATLGAMV